MPAANAADALRPEVEALLAQWAPEVYIVRFVAQPGQGLRLVIDTDEGLALDLCESIHRRLRAHINQPDQPHWEPWIDLGLEVGSPGVGDPLLLPRQYTKNLGRHLRVTQVDGQVTQGELVAFDGQTITLRPAPATKPKPGKAPPPAQPVTVPMAQVKQAVVEVVF